MTQKQKKFAKLACLLLAVLISLTLVEVAVKFNRDYRYIGFEKRQNNWIDIAERAQVDAVSCNQELEEVRKQKQAAIEANNSDLFQ